MSYLVVVWIFWSSMSFMLGIMHLLFWFSNSRKTAYLFSASMGFAAAVSGIFELQMLLAQSPEEYGGLLLWENLAIYFILVPMVWFVYCYFGTGRLWLANLITLLWTAGIGINFLMPGNLAFTRVLELQYVVSFWGETFALPVGEINAWKILADLASLLILVFVVDASLTLWRRQQKNRAWVVGGAISTFILFAGIHTPLVDAGLVQAPYLISFAFQAIVLALSYQVVMDAVKVSRYEQELDATRYDLDRITRTNLLGEYATILAHELSQPLAAILSNAQAARSYLAADASQQDRIKEILEDIVHDDRRASEIIDWLRNMLQEQGGSSEWFQMDAAINDVRDVLSRNIQGKKISLSIKYDQSLPLVYARKMEIQLVLLNLLSNAIRAIDGLPRNRRVIKIRVYLAGDLAVEVLDLGRGVPTELQSTMFDAFVSGSKDGFGMGLAICLRIIESHDGRIWANFQNKTGTVVSFALPVTVENG